MSARFTLVTPVLNGMPWLKDAVASVAAQRTALRAGGLLRHVVMDAGSTDGSRAWLTAWHEGERAQDTTLVFAPDGGIVDALTRAYASVAGEEILGWLNADDLLEPRALARVADAFAANPRAGLVAGACLYTDSAGAPFLRRAPPAHADFATLLCRTACLPQPATFFRAEAFTRAGGFNTRYSLVFDSDLYLRIARDAAVVTLPHELLARFRVRGDSLSGAAPARAALEELDFRRRLGLPLMSTAAAVLAVRGYLFPQLPARLLGTARSAKRRLGRLRATCY